MSAVACADDYDVTVIGGGLVGASMACACSGLGLRIAVIEAQPFRQSQHPSYDDRSVALALGTYRILQTLDLSKTLDKTAIHRIHISESGQAGLAQIDRQLLNVEALGYVVETRNLGQVLDNRLRQSHDIDLLCPAQIQAISFHTDKVQLTANVDQANLELSTKLLIAADGADSATRKLTGIDHSVWHYGQTAIVTNLSPEFSHNNIAYERFTDSGPLALLPLSENRCALVCTLNDAKIDNIMALNEQAFGEYLQQRFGDRLGRFKKIGKRSRYPLQLTRSHEATRHRLAVIGNAAHALHPVAGQGFNLSMRDVAVLAETIADSQSQTQDLGSMDQLKQYAQWRRSDQWQTMLFTDSIARLSSNPLMPMRIARNLGLTAFNLCPPAKRVLAEKMMGLSGHSPRLARGLKLTEMLS